MIDRITFHTGFSDALINVGWLEGKEGAYSLPNFDKHNGQTAKTRAATNRRVARSRANCNAPTVTKTEQKPLPEKRREEVEKNKVNTPLQIRISKLVKRRESTKWSDKEVKALAKLKPTDEDIAFLESKDYVNHPYRRKDLFTMLNNWSGELDRMNATEPTHHTASNVTEYMGD
jgi:hypothetical protein